MLEEGAVRREVAVPLPVAAATVAPAEVKGLPMADSEEVMQVVNTFLDLLATSGGTCTRTLAVLPPPRLC